MTNSFQAIIEADRQLALAYSPARDVVAALFRIDAHLARIALTTHEPMLARIKLAWWRDEGFRERAGATELAADVGLVCRAMADGADWLGRLADGWDAIVADGPDRQGTALFGAIAAISGRELDAEQLRAAEAWGRAELALLTGDAERLSQARAEVGVIAPAVFRRPLTCLGVMVALTRHNVARGPERAWSAGSPKRMARALWFALTRH